MKYIGSDYYIITEKPSINDKLLNMIYEYEKEPGRRATGIRLTRDDFMQIKMLPPPILHSQVGIYENRIGSYCGLEILVTDADKTEITGNVEELRRIKDGMLLD
jgi:hypothetical protein